MQRFQVSDEYEESDEVVETINYNMRAKGYVLSGSSKVVDVAIISRDDFFRFLAGEVTHIFPQYDKVKHYVNCDEWNAVHNNYDTVPMKLYERLEQTELDLPYGSYIFTMHDRYGIVLKPIKINTDKYIQINKKDSLDLLSDFKEFRNSKDLFKKLQQRARRNILLYGAPGNGKTIEICKLAAQAEAEKFRVFFINRNDFSLNMLIPFKDILDKEDSVFVLEEITERTDKNSLEELLSFLDGEMSWDNCYTIATTNHPEELPWNVVDRPSRFKIIKEFKPLDADERKDYLQKMNVPQENLAEAIKCTDGLSFDYLKHIIFDSFLSGKSIPDVVKQYKETKEKISGRFRKQKLGI